MSETVFFEIVRKIYVERILLSGSRAGILPLCAPEQDIDLLLPSFRPFRCERPGEEEVLFKFIALTCFFQAAEVVTVLEEAKTNGDAHASFKPPMDFR